MLNTLNIFVLHIVWFEKYIYNLFVCTNKYVNGFLRSVHGAMWRWLVYFITGKFSHGLLKSTTLRDSFNYYIKVPSTCETYAPYVNFLRSNCRQSCVPAPFPKYRPMNSTGTPTGTRLIIPPSLVKLWAERRGVVGWSRLQPWTHTNSIRPKCWWIGGSIWPTKEPCKGDRACTRILGPAPFRQLTRWIQ